jgi:hypothetical protein
MNDAAPPWLLGYAEAAQLTDRLADRADHIPMLAAGLIGEAGSIIAELKKEEREREAYPPIGAGWLRKLEIFSGTTFVSSV